MPKLSEFYGIQIILRFAEANHPRAHFHAQYAEHQAVFAIDNLEVLAGYIPQRAYEMVLAWAALHRAELQAAWDAARSGRKPAKIAPLN